jgi:2-methylcitrate dehydratase PrpD
MDLAARYAAFGADLAFEKLPTEVIEDTKKLILDQLGVMLVGSSAAGVDSLLATTRRWGGAKEASVLVHGDKLPAHHAAMINGTMARAQDFDSVHEGAIVHLTAGSLPQCLAAAERKGCVTGHDFITAMALAMEFMVRLGVSFETSFLKTGRVTTLHQATFGGALGAAKIMGLDQRQTVSALGLAYGQVAGNLQVTVEGTVLVRVLQGFAAQTAVQSAIMAEDGLVGPERVFQGEWGYFKSYHDNKYRADVLTEGLGKEWKLLETSIKYYPCCFLAHFAIGAMTDLVKAKKVKPSDIEAITARVTQGTFNVVCSPQEAKRAPVTTQQALFSLPYTVAAAAHTGRLTLAEMTPEAISDPGVLATAQKVTSVVDAELEAKYGRIIGPSILDVTLRDGSKLSQRVDRVKGHPAMPMSYDDVAEKFRSCVPFAARKLDGKKLERVIEEVRHLEKVKDVADIVRLLT